MLSRQCKLPYDHDALEPYLSRESVLFHYDKHHAAYAEKLESLIRGTAYESMDLEGIIDAARRNADIDVLNNAATRTSRPGRSRTLLNDSSAASRTSSGRSRTLP